MDAMELTDLYPRFIRPRLVEALADTPVVLIHGPRQCGKTTLARQAGEAAGNASAILGAGAGGTTGVSAADGTASSGGAA